MKDGQECPSYGKWLSTQPGRLGGTMVLNTSPTRKRGREGEPAPRLCVGLVCWALTAFVEENAYVDSSGQLLHVPTVARAVAGVAHSLVDRFEAVGDVQLVGSVHSIQGFDVALRVPAGAGFFHQHPE